MEQLILNLTKESTEVVIISWLMVICVVAFGINVILLGIYIIKKLFKK